MSYTLEMHEVFVTSQTAEQTFEYIVDFSHIDEWDHTIVSSEKVGDTAIDIGTRFNLMFAMGRRKSPIVYEITAFVPHSKAVLTGVSKRFTAVDTVGITETEKGCKVDWHAKIEFTGLTALFIPLIAKKIKAGGAKTIRDLNLILDSKSGSK